MNSLIRRNYNFFNDDIFDTFFLSPTRRRDGTNYANIVTTDTGYEIELIAPGFSTSDFNIEVDSGSLIISGKHENANKNYATVEYSVGSFERRFNLPKEINIDGIRANYEAGILRVDIPYNRERQNTKRIVEIG